MPVPTLATSIVSSISVADSIQIELDRWEDYFERLQVRSALRAASAREQAAEAITELRRRRRAASDRLAELRAAPGDACDRRRQRLGAARDELRRTAGDTAAKLV